MEIREQERKVQVHSTRRRDKRVPDRIPPEGQGPWNPSGNQGRHTSLDNPPSPRGTRLRREMSRRAEAGTSEALSAIQGTHVSPRDSSGDSPNSQARGGGSAQFYDYRE